MEKAGIPSVALQYPDQINYHKNVALKNGVPQLRYVAVPRIGTAEELVAQYIDNVIKALCDPLTAKEQEKGLYSPPAPPRVIFEGTVDEAQDYLQQTTLIENCRMCPIAKYTDGLPVIVPTEEKVAAMLTGTSHKPTETVMRVWGSAATTTREETAMYSAQVTYAQNYTSTVEKVAVCAVMAGCKPQYMPVALAVATAGGGATTCPGTSSMWPVWFVVSGPIAKEIGMNAGQQSMDVGNPANSTLGRVGALMTVNFGGCITGVVRTDSGNPIHSVMFAEDTEGNPPGWVGYNEENTYYDSTTKKTVSYTKKDSVLGKGGGWGLVTGLFSFPGYYRSLNSGTMGIARYLGVEGKPGKYNWMEAILPIIVRAMPAPGSSCFILHMNLAQLLYENGLKTKDELYKWMWETYTIPVTQYRNSGLFDHPTNGGTTIEPTSGKSWLDLIATDPNYQLHVFGGANYKSNCVIIADSFADEHWYYSVFGGKPSAYPIDPWR
jgi:hypothetical protein